MANCFCLNPACPQPENSPEAEKCQACGSPLLLRNRYRAYKRIGQGGFGATFLARDMDMPSKPPRVIKQLRPVESSPQIAELSLQLFNREAEVLEKLGEHSQIPKLFAHFEERDKFYLVQEFIHGVTLSHELHHYGPMSEEQVRHVLQEMLLILSYVHSHNTVHRDIKPANLIRRKADQRLVLIDFGAVKELNPDPTKETPMEATAIRSLGFSPPEQVSGTKIVPASDIYALGATCLNLLTRESPAKLYDHDQGRWDWSSRIQLSPEFETILLKMLEQSLGNRYATATEVLRALQGLSEEGNGSRQSVIVLPQSYGSPSTSSMISTHWSTRRSEGFSAPPGGKPMPSLASMPGKSMPPPSTTGFSGKTTSGFYGRNSGYGNASTGFSRSNPTVPRIPSMANADLRGRSLARQALAGRDLRRADLRGTDLTSANLQRADLRGVQFNTPKPPVVRAALWLFGQAMTLSGVVAGLIGIVGSAAVGFAVSHFLFHQVLVSVAAGFFGMLSGAGVLWSIAGRHSFGIFNEAQTKTYTCLRKTDLRGAHMDDKFRAFAKSQGAILD
jgi:serine/threonine-protein kinase